MLSLYLQKQILEFVDTFYLVKERQIRKFFADWGEGAVNHALKELLDRGLLTRHSEKYVSCARKLPMSILYYEPCITALEVMIVLSSQKIVWYSREKYPNELAFATTDNVYYDVAVFDNQWVTKYSNIPASRVKCLPPGESDTTLHVAVVPDKEIAEKVDKLGFALYAIVDSETGKLEMFSFNE